MLRLRSEVKALRAENADLRKKNASMRQGMRRCVTCEYRLDYKQRQGEAPVLQGQPADTPDG
ncbi:MAG: hypothetical protein Hals2KO_22640 [Halioglobus sp.]